MFQYNQQLVKAKANSISTPTPLHNCCGNCACLQPHCHSSTTQLNNNILTSIYTGRGQTDNINLGAGPHTLISRKPNIWGKKKQWEKFLTAENKNLRIQLDICIFLNNGFDCNVHTSLFVGFLWRITWLLL